jgi:AraC-like DNA-binding protein
MIITAEKVPAPALAPFVHSYAYRAFDTHGTDMIKPWHATRDSNITFFFEDLPLKLADPVTGKVLKTGRYCDVVGVSTQYNGDMYFNGSYSFLQILFQPHGFYTLFNVSPLEFADKIVWSGDIFGSDIRFLHEKLYSAKSLTAMAGMANNWLMQYLNKKRRVDYKDRITITANLIIKNAGLINIDALAAYACMSTRNFERSFINETGMSPKQLCCIARFNNALELKLGNPAMKWTSVAQESGYFDQMHLIKDFKRYCGEAPSSLLKHVPLLEERYIHRVSHH